MLKKLSINNKKWVIIIVVLVLIIPVAVFAIFSVSKNNSKSSTPLPEKPPLPTFPDTPRVEGELVIKYMEGNAFDSLSEERKSEISDVFKELGVVSQEKVYDSEEGELSLYYLLKFSEGVDIETAAQKIYQLSEIEDAKPNSQSELF